MHVNAHYYRCSCALIVYPLNNFTEQRGLTHSAGRIDSVYLMSLAGNSGGGGKTRLTTPPLSLYILWNTRTTKNQKPNIAKCSYQLALKQHRAALPRGGRTPHLPYRRLGMDIRSFFGRASGGGAATPKAASKKSGQGKAGGSKKAGSPANKSSRAKSGNKGVGKMT